MCVRNLNISVLLQYSTFLISSCCYLGLGEGFGLAAASFLKPTVVPNSTTILCCVRDNNLAVIVLNRITADSLLLLNEESVNVSKEFDGG